ncbi:MAG: glycosyltransferase family 4 protein [Candidatus Obscuribacterales bacterium]
MKNWYTETQSLPSRAIEVIPPYLPVSNSPRAVVQPPIIGFAAYDFDVKGGPILLEAFKLVRQVYPDCILHIVGSTPRLTPAEARRGNIIWESAVDRVKLLDVILPELTVFAYPTKFDGLPLILLDVLSLGIPSVCSNYPPITELVEHEVDGLICDTDKPRELADNIIRLLDPNVNARYSEQIRRRFRERFSSDAVKPQLSTVYTRVANKVP